MNKVTRLVVVDDETGRAYDSGYAMNVEAMIQDEGRTLKVFVSGGGRQLNPADDLLFGEESTL